MSVIVLGAFVLSIVIAAGLLTIAMKQITSRLLRCVLVAVAALLWVPLSMGLIWLSVCLTTTYRHDVKPADVPLVQLPVGATNVCYRRALASGLTLVVQFRVTEEEFLGWMESRGWEPEPITVPQPIAAFLDGRGRGVETERVVVADGLRFDDYAKDQFDDSGTTVVYDRATGLAHLARTDF